MLNDGTMYNKLVIAALNPVLPNGAVWLLH
jgi:hypothetical protein